MTSSTEKHLYIISALLVVLGIVTSWWLLDLYTNLLSGTGTLESACHTIANAGGGCETIALSSYSKLGSLPIAAVALAYFLVQIFLLLWMLLFEENRQGLLQTSFLFSSLALPVTFCMMFISFFLVQDLCLMCSLIWLINLLLWPIFAHLLGYYSFPFKFELNTKSFSINPFSDTTQANVSKRALITSVIVFAIALLISHTYTNKNIKENPADIRRIVSMYQKAPAVFLPEKAYEGHVKGEGAKNAIITILNFSDFQCPYCKKAAINFKTFYIKNKKDIHFVYRHYPLDPSCNPTIKDGMFLSCKIAAAAECAGQQGKFYEMHDRAFDMQKNMSSSKLKELSEDMNLNMAEYEACITNPETQKKIQQDISFAELANIQATPTFIINGKKLSKALSPKQWETLFNFLKKQ